MPASGSGSGSGSAELFTRRVVFEWPTSPILIAEVTLLLFWSRPDITWGEAIVAIGGAHVTLNGWDSTAVPDAVMTSKEAKMQTRGERPPRADPGPRVNGRLSNRPL